MILEEQKTLVVTEKKLGKISNVFNRYPFRSFKVFFLFKKKIAVFSGGGGFNPLPPPLSFYYMLP